jgi:hypothetical protein
MKAIPRFDKLCPFCPQKSYGYHFKTWCGLLHHVHREHLKVISRERGYENSWYVKGDKWKAGQLIYIRVYDVPYSKYHDLDIKSPEECEKLLYAYVTDNPSFRGFMKKESRR